MRGILGEWGGLGMSVEGWRPYGQGQQPAGPYGPYGQQSMMRASSADRERAADVLKAGFAEGRLSQQEFEARLTQAQQASTYGQLQAIVGDLPQGPVQHQQPQIQQAPQPYWPARPMPVPPPMMIAPELRTNGNATAALICGVLTPFTWGLTAIPAVILGHKARGEIRRSREQGDGQAVTGLVFGYLGITFWVLVTLAIILASS
jgi:uncharacterized protein DUF4190/uncharacterized protein DUF1707